MILRRLTDALRKQDWATVVIETLIVVFGVFIGLQVNNWNEVRSDHARYEEARQQLIDETRTNLTIVRSYVETYETRLTGIRAAISVLRNCESGPEALETVERGLDMLRSTPNLTLQNSAITFLAEDEKMLAIQDDEERLRLQSYNRRNRQMIDGASVVEHMPDRLPVEDHPMVGYGDLSPGYIPANGADERPLVLVAPLEEACLDPTLAKRFYLWERVGVFAILIGENLEGRFEDNLSALEAAP